jgi:hypothetical protein
MPRRSNKSISEILSQKSNGLPLDDKHIDLLERKITIATEGFITDKFCKLVLRDRSRLSDENALTICDYVIAMKREINPRLSYKRSIVQILSVIKSCWNRKEVH